MTEIRSQMKSTEILQVRAGLEQQCSSLRADGWQEVGRIESTNKRMMWYYAYVSFHHANGHRLTLIVINNDIGFFRDGRYKKTVTITLRA